MYFAVADIRDAKCGAIWLPHVLHSTSLCFRVVYVRYMPQRVQQNVAPTSTVLIVSVRAPLDFRKKPRYAFAVSARQKSPTVANVLVTP